MAKLIYGVISSLDGYIADTNGEFDWSAPDEEVHAFVNDLERPVGTYLYGRRLYEIMRVWETLEDDDSPAMNDYASIWRAADKIVYSRSLPSVDTSRTTLERSFDPDAIARLKETAAADIGVGGAHLAAQALKAGLVDEIYQFISPVIVGGGTRFVPEGLALDLALTDERRFGNGVVYASYRVGQ